jgi:Ca2+:H+ antiporter
VALAQRHRALGAFLCSGQGWPYLLTPFIVLAIVLDVVGAPAVAVFFVSVLAVVPTAALMGRSTEELAARSGPGIGGLLNVTFGNAPELIIALFALGDGLQTVVKASLVGSILSNLLLVLGASFLVGGVGRTTQRFNRTAANSQAAMLLLAAAALVMPAVFRLVQGGGLPGPGAPTPHYGADINHISAALAIVMIAAYLGFLWFSLRSHRDIFSGGEAAEAPARAHRPWSVRRSVALLALAGAAVAGMSQILVSSIEDASQAIGLSDFFVAVIVVAIAGNAAEHWTAVYVARRDQMDLSVNIAVGSSTQVALFVLPVLVLVSFVLGAYPMGMVLNGLELAGVLLAIFIASHVTNEGESTWSQGAQLLGVYVVLAIVFFFA